MANHLCHAGRLWSQHQLWPLKSAKMYQLWYRSHPRGSRKATLEEMDIFGDSNGKSHEMKVTSHLEALENMFDETTYQSDKGLNWKEEQLREKIKLKIIQRKYFRPQQEMNLLTWSAKEQIRYLRQEFPDEWTVERIAKSFPVTAEGVVKLLKSKYSPKNQPEIIKHDKRVKSNLLKLSDGKNSSLAQQYNKMLTDGVIGSLENATGNVTIPTEKQRITQCLPDRNDDHHMKRREQKKTGLFESIVKNYCEKKNTGSSFTKLEDFNQPNGEKMPTEITSMAAKSVKSIATVSKNKSKMTHRPTKTSSTANIKAYDFNDFNIGTSNCNIITRDPPNRDEPLENELSSKNHLTEKMINLDSSSPKDKKGFLIDHISKYKHDKAKDVPQNVAEDVRFDMQHNINDKRQGYIYDSNTGYQYPYGKVDNSFHDIQVNKSTKPTDFNTNKLLRKGDNFYDDDGDFIFRVPY